MIEDPDGDRDEGTAGESLEQEQEPNSVSFDSGFTYVETNLGLSRAKLSPDRWSRVSSVPQPSRLTHTHLSLTPLKLKQSILIV